MTDVTVTMSTAVVTVADTSATVNVMGPAIPTVTVSAGGVLPSLFSGSFIDSTVQTNGGTAVANLVSIGASDDAYGISLQDGSKIVYANAGRYMVNFLGQFITTGGGSNYAVTVWYAVNGSAVTNSAYQYTTTGVGGQVLGNIQDIVVANAGDYVQFYWWSTNTYMRLTNVAAGTAPTRPASPSVNINTYNVG